MQNLISFRHDVNLCNAGIFVRMSTCLATPYNHRQVARKMLEGTGLAFGGVSASLVHIYT